MKFDPLVTGVKVVSDLSEKSYIFLEISCMIHSYILKMCELYKSIKQLYNALKHE